MISIKEALQIVSSQDVHRRTKHLPLLEAVGFHLAEEIIAPLSLPPFDNSAMDGYAVCGYAVTYHIKGEVAAGETASFTLNEGEAMRIFTGGRVPANTTAVIMQEKTTVNGKLLNVSDEVVKGKNIRRKGEELAQGDRVFEVGQKITSAAVGTISSLGLAQVMVYDKPRISIITTGNELVEAGTPLQEGQIYESNGATLRASLSQYGFDAQPQLKIKDDFDAIKWGVGGALQSSDVILLSGGISVGDYDFVKKALEENGVRELFYKVAQKPGKPLYFGRKGEVFVFALPGNPASALTGFYIYVLPLLQKLQGSHHAGLLKLKLPLAHEYIMKSDRPTFFKANIADGKLSLMHGQGSNMLHSLALGNALAFLDKQKRFEEGEMVECYCLE